MRRILTLFIMLMLSGVLAFAQNRVVTGTVTDNNGQPIEGASVRVKGSRTGVAADASGNYSISVPAGATLVFSGVGITSREIAVGNQSVVNANLVRSGSELSAVVVTALGQSTKKVKVPYATSNFNSAQINRAAPSNVLDALAGKIPGANISKTGGPGSSTKVVLRGYGIIGNNQPLYVVDGIPLNDSRLGSTNGNIDFGNGLNDINPEDIENISVLPGTTASSLYGGNAKNGAIMITTKRGRSGKLRVDYNGSVNMSQVGKLPDMQRTFGQGWGGIFVLPENGSWGPRLDGKQRAWGSIVNNTQLIKPFSFIEDNMRNFYDNGMELNNTISLSGGNEGSQFYFSYGNVSSDGVIPTNIDFYQRNTFSLRTNSKFNNFSINTSFNYVDKKQNAPFTGQPSSDGGSTFEALLQIPVDVPITDFKDYKNIYFNVDNYFTPYDENPYYPIYENLNRQNSDRFYGNIDMTYKFTNHLSAQLTFGGDVTNARTYAYKAINDPSIGSWNKGGNTEGAKRAADVGSVSEGAANVGSVNSDFRLKYNQDITSAFNLDALVGVNYYQEDQKSSASRITNLFIPGFYNLSNSLAPPTASDFFSHRKRIGVYAQASLGFRNQVFLTVNARNDWSSTLPIESNSIFYPGAGLSWVASQTFGLTNSPISFLKFRASYGKTGSDAPPYDIYSTLALGSVGLGFGSLTFPFNGATSFGISNQIGNATLKPTITTEAEVGTEIRFFKNRIGLDVALYDKRSKAQILGVPIAPSSGFTTEISNLGLVENKGIEVAFDVKPIDGKNFTWTVNYTFSKNWNKLVYLTTGLSNVPLNSLYDVELIGYPGKSLTGLYAPQYQYSPDGKIVVNPVNGMPVEAADKAFYGNAEYDYMMGMLNTFSYKNLQLSFSLDYRVGGKMYSGTADLLNFTGNAYNTTYNDRRPFIVPNSVNAVVDAAGKTTYVENKTAIPEADYYDYFYPTVNKAGSEEARIIDKSFLKLRDISLTYNLSKRWANKIHASNISLSVYGRNFLLWTPVSNFYIDPEASNLGNDLISELGEFRTAPTSHQFGLSLKTSF